jgi:excisionase family DNA binding protein
MSLAEMLERQTKVLRAKDVARLFEVTPQHIYKMAASGRIPSFRVAGAIRFDPQELANWLRRAPSAYTSNGRQALERIA